MGKSGQHKKGQKRKSKTGKMPEDDKNHPSQAEISQPLPAEMPGLVQYKCGHRHAKPLKYTVDILVRTMKFVLVERDTKEGLIKGRIEFECVPYVDGRITLEFSTMVLGSPGSSPTKKVLVTITLDVKKELGKKLMHVPIEFPIDTIRLKDPYKVEIKTEAKHVTIEFNVCQLTLAVIKKVNGDFQIRVKDQIVWVNQDPYICHDSTGIFKALDIVNKKSDPQCGRCLVINNPGVLEPIGNISVTSEIGRGSNTTVFNGTFHDRPCAVKRYPITEREFAEKDVRMMKDIGSHPNIVSYNGMAKDAKFVLVAVESCKCSLDKLIASRVFENEEYKLKLEGFEDLVLWKRKKDPRRTESPPKDICKVYPSEHLLKFLRGIVTGLSWLHSRNISHNNLKIQNVLISRDTTVDDTTVVDIIPKLSNFSRSSTIGTTGSGSSGGQEPTFPLDLKDLGNLLLNCMAIPRDGYTGEAKVNWLKHLPEAYDLIPKLLNLNSELRPTAAQVKMHPFLWGPKGRLSFLYFASECIKKNNQESRIQESYENTFYKGSDGIVDKKLTKEIESVQANLNEKNHTTSTASDCEERKKRRFKIREALLNIEDYNGWDNNVGEELVKQIEARQAFLNEKNKTNVTPSYHGDTLLQVIRNHYIHLPLLPQRLRNELGESFTQLDDYFSSRFPKFLMQVYDLFKRYPVNGKTLIDEYCELWEI